MTTSGNNDTRSVVIKPTVDASAVRPGVSEVKREVGSMADAVRNAGQRAGAGLEAMGQGAKTGAAEAARALASTQREFQRLEAELLSGGRRGTAAYALEFARLKGVSEEALGPMAARYKALEEAQRRTTVGQQQMTVSAAQTVNALRQVPMQFTDIFTSLAAGQSPLMVLLQQGGQLKDSFGGAGAAARALGGYVAGLINPFTLLAAAVGATVIGYAMGSQEQQRFAAGLILSGNAAGTSAGQLAVMAAAIDALSNGGTQSKAAEVLTIIAGAGEVAAGSLQRFTLASIAMERAGGPAAAETAKAFAELGKSPLQASLRLTESLRYLDAATADQISTLERQGRTVEAAQLAQDAYANALEQRAPEMEARLGTLERLWRGIKDATKEAGDELLQLGRSTSLQDQIQAVNEQLGRAQRLQGNGGGGFLGQLLGGSQAELQAQREALLEQLRLQQRAAELQGARTRQEEARVQWDKAGLQYMSDRVKLEEEVLRIRNQGATAKASEDEIADRLRSMVAKRFEGKTGGSDKAERDRERALQAEARLLAELSGVTTDYAADLQTLNDAYARGRLDYDAFVDATAKLSARQPGMVARARELAKAADDEADAKRRQQQEQARYLAGIQAEGEAAERTTQQLRLEIVEMTQGKQARAALEIDMRERVALTHEQAAAMLELNDADGTYHRIAAERIKNEIRERRRLQEVLAAKEVSDANQRAARQAADEWKRAADDAGAALANALMQGGKSAWEYIVGTVRAQVLTPAVRYITQPITAGILGALGPSGAAAAAGGGAGGGLGLIGAGGLLSGLGSAFGAGATLGIGSFGGAGLALSGAGSMLANGSILGGLAQGAGALVGALGPAFIGRLLGQQLSGGFNFGGSGNGTVNAGAVLGGIFGGPLGAGLGALAGGGVNRLFGRKVADTGIEGTFSAGEFGGQAFTFEKGGTFRSDKSTGSALSAEAQAVLNAGSLAALSSARAYADVLNLPAKAMDGIVSSIKLSLKDLSEEQVQQRITEAVAGYQEALLGAYRAQLEPLRKLGESLTDTAARLSNLQVFSQGLIELGGVFSRVANSSVAARENLIEMVGGMDSLASLAQQYAQQYFSRDEIAGIKARDLQTALSSVGITQDLRSRDDFRSLVEGTDVSTEDGRRRLAQLLRVSGDFAGLSDYLGETGIGLQAAARQAPETAQLADLFNSGTQEQVTATNEVRDSVDRVGNLIGRLLDLMGRSIGGTGSSVPIRDRVPEVLLD
jgi:phage-related minor tail protein